MVTVKLLVWEYKSDSETRVKYLYTTDLSLSEEEMEEAWRMRWEIEELHRDVKALGLEDSSFWRREASGVPHDLHHHDQRRQGASGGS